jgi:hypothetical protein
MSADPRSLARWRRNPVSWIETHLIDPETGKAFKLLPAEKEFLKLALAIGPDGRLLYPELIFGAIKKSGKTGFASIFVLALLLLFGGPYAEAYIAANDLSRPARYCVARRRSAPIALPSLPPAPPSGCWQATSHQPLAAIRRSAFLTNCGATPASVRAGFTTSLCPFRRGTLVAVWW